MHASADFKPAEPSVKIEK